MQDFILVIFDVSKFKALIGSRYEMEKMNTLHLLEVEFVVINATLLVVLVHIHPVGMFSTCIFTRIHLR